MRTAAQQGFKKSIEDSVICRWHYDDIILDVMPTDQKILGFGNRWYKAAISQAIIHKIAEDLSIKSITAPYFLATKLEAFKDRGKNDFLGSHDLEDIITVIDGRAEIVHETSASDKELKEYLIERFSDLLKTDDFLFSLAGHLNYYGQTTENRARIVLDRLKNISKTNIQYNI